MKTINTPSYPIFFGQEPAYQVLNTLISQNNYSKIFILADENTSENCLVTLLQNLSFEAEVLEIESGEQNKNIETCLSLWNTLSEFQADRKSLLINLGGGVLSDLGGFVASTYMRGIHFINIPTTLLSMVDASVGGKTGVDLNELKNQIGLINNPQAVLIDVSFLQTLPPAHMRSGLAEMLKHGLIYSQQYWNDVKDITKKSFDQLEDLIFQSVEIKNYFVTQDPTEKNIRKALNYGHTLGHAIESYSIKASHMPSLLHGEAVAIGLVLETFISSKITNLPLSLALEVKNVVADMYPHVSLSPSDISQISELMKHDKKNSFGNINFVLLSSLGTPLLDCSVPPHIMNEAYDFYHN